MWGVVGWYLVIYYSIYIYFPLIDQPQLANGIKVAEPASFFCMTTTVGCMTVITLAKRWVKKEREWLDAEKERVAAQLQILKAQLHPHFLFNTLNNIYSFSLKNSPKTPGLILKLSSLLNYMLYDCKAAEVSLEKELEIMKNYIDLEKERYGNEIEISLSIDGDVKDKYIAPLLLLPFLENAFKHGTSEQLENPWLSVDVNVNKNTLSCKILNSKNEFVKVSENGIGIENVKKRLAFLYPGIHELNITDEKDFFVVTLTIKLMNNNITYPTASVVYLPVAEKVLS